MTRANRKEWFKEREFLPLCGQKLPLDPIPPFLKQREDTGELAGG
jgi:hypothetical protein